MAALLEGDTDAARLSVSASRLSVNRSVCAMGKNIASQSGLAAEGLLLLQDLGDVIGFVFVQTAAEGVAHFVFHGGIQQIRHDHMPTGYEFTRPARYLGDQSFFNEGRSRFQA